MYITEGDIEKFLLQDIDSSYSTWITTIIGYVEDYVDKYCGTNFKDQGSGTRYYDGSGSAEINIDNLQSVSSVQILDADGNVEVSLTENTDFWLYPLNDSVKNKLVSNTYVFPNRPRSLKVTGTFGYLTTPEPIKFAAIQLAAKIINQGLRGGQVKSENLGSYSITYRDIDEESESMGIKEILNQYREARLY